jgi:2-(1,2-epoxy-1,2-dihydrophenyl)acetyl-CoA isomerase
MAYTRAGLCPEGSSSYFLPRLVGLRRAQELMLTNPTLDAHEAVAMGLVTRVVADADLVAAQLADAARLLSAYLKKLLQASQGNDLETQMDMEAQLLSQCAASVDGREEIQAFFDKRDPEFQ